MDGDIAASDSAWAKRMEKGSHEFVVENFSVSGAKYVIESEEFMLGGHSWVICFYPNGRKDPDGKNDNGGYASIFVRLTSQGNHPAQILFELCVLDQSGKGNHKGVSTFERKSVRALMVNHVAGSYKCIERALLDLPGSDYVKNDCVRIQGIIGVYTFGSMMQPHIMVPKSNLAADLGKLLESKEWADVIIHVGGERFCAHKFILAARCPALLSLQRQSDDFVVSDIEPVIFKAVLWFVYTGTLCEDENEKGVCSVDQFFVKLLAAAEQLKLRRLKQMCESRILENVCVESVGYLLHVADACKAAELKSLCLKFAVENRAAFMESSGFEYLKENCPFLFLELAGLREHPTISVKGVLNMYNKVVSIFKKPATYKKLKIKEV